MNKVYAIIIFTLSTFVTHAQTDTIAKIADSIFWEDYEHLSAAGDYLQNYRLEMRVSHVFSFLGAGVLGVGTMSADNDNLPPVLVAGGILLGIGTVIAWIAPSSVGKAGDELRAIYINKKQGEWKKKHPPKKG